MKALGLSLLFLVSGPAWGQSKVAVEGVNQFAFQAFLNLSEGEKQFFFSPYSIETALAMTSAGAQKETLRQMKKTLHLKSDYHASFDSLSKELASTTDFELHVANRLWGKKGSTYKPEFMKTLQESYNSSLAILDFGKNSAAAVKEINQWVEEQTREKIKDILQPNDIDDKTELVITNALYFKAEWLVKFDPRRTEEEPFYQSSKLKTTIPFMNMTEMLPYGENSDWQYLRLPYKGDQVAMEVFLPKEKKDLDKLLKGKGASYFQRLAHQSKLHNTMVSLPHFKMETRLDLKESLSKMGMPRPFEETKADFGGIQELKKNESIFISKVIHKTFVDINEAGTEAAAATAVVLAKTMGMPAPPKVFKANRPFFFIIRHVKTGVILFMGRFAAQ